MWSCQTGRSLCQTPLLSRLLLSSFSQNKVCSQFVRFPVHRVSLASTDIWTTNDLAEKLGGVDIPSIDKAMEFWMDHGVVKSLGDKTYQLLEIAEEGKPSGPRPMRKKKGKLTSSLLQMPAVERILA